MTTQHRNWVRIIGITGAVLVVASALTLGGLFLANATGVITLPQSSRGMHMDVTNGMIGGMFGGRGGHEGRTRDHGGKHGRGGDMMPSGGMGMLDGMGGMQFGGIQVSPEAKSLIHTIEVLQYEQALATALADTSPAAKAIAATRVSEIATLTAWATEWYPDGTVPTAPSASGTIADLRQLVTHNTLRIDKAATKVTFTHAELQQWLMDSLPRRATESATLIEGQTS